MVKIKIQGKNLNQHTRDKGFSKTDLPSNYPRYSVNTKPYGGGYRSVGDTTAVDNWSITPADRFTAAGT